MAHVSRLREIKFTRSCLVQHAIESCLHAAFASKQLLGFSSLFRNDT